MSSYTFTVTQTSQNFTATISYPINLTLKEDPDRVNVVNNQSTITVTTVRQPITISGVGGAGGANYNQSLNTTDNVAFASVTTPAIYGVAGQPVEFPTGISAANLGSTFVGDYDLGNLGTPVTNQIALIMALLPMDFGTAASPNPMSVDFGTI